MNNTEPCAIVRELAERGPFTEGECCLTCVSCGVTYEMASAPEAISDPANHDPSCLWRRAKALYPDEG